MPSLISLTSLFLFGYGALAEHHPGHHSFCRRVSSQLGRCTTASSVSSYCSSYLSATVATVTQTASTTVDEASTSTITDTVTGFATPYGSCGTSIQQISYSPQASYTPSEAARAKRTAAAKKPKPSCLSQFTASTALSSACSCVFKPTTTTTTYTPTSYTTTVTTTTTSILGTQNFKLYADGIGWAAAPFQGPLTFDMQKESEADVFTNGEYCELEDLTHGGFVFAPASGGEIYKQYPPPGGDDVVYLYIDSTTYAAVVKSQNGQTVSSVCPEWYVEDGVPTNCNLIDLYAIPVSPSYS